MVVSSSLPSNFHGSTLSSLPFTISSSFSRVSSTAASDLKAKTSSVNFDFFFGFFRFYFN